MANSSGKPGRRPIIGKRKLALFVGFCLSLLLPIVLTAIGFFLAIWLIVPAPNFFWLPFAIAAPELSPWLVGLNAIAVLLALINLTKHWLYGIALAISLLSLLVSALPLLQLSATQQQMVAAMETGLGNNYLTEIPLEWRSRLRPYPFSLPDALLGIPVAEGQETKGIVFAEPDGIPLKLNVYRSSQPGKQPTLIIIHGGAWRSGDANNDEPFSRYMAAQGYTVITITYRQTPQYRFPVQLEDVRSALAFIQQSADRLDVDQNRVALMGRSAGAHLAMLTAYQPSSLPIRAVVNYYGPVDLTAGYADPPQPDPIDTRAVLRDFLGGTPDQLPDLYRQASPITYATKPVPPTLLMYARRDHLVQAKFGRSLDQQLRSVNSQVVYLEIPWAEHAFDAIFQGVSNQLASYHTDRFLAWALQPK